MRKIIDNRFIFFSFSFLVLLALYFPTFEAGPIWDDHYFLFGENFNWTGDLFELLKHYSWPVSVLLQKIMLDLFGEQFFYHHSINFLLHFVNALLFYQFLRLQKISAAKWGYLIFLLHPAMIISVAWIIQLKTLLCGFFALLSINLFLYAQRSTVVKTSQWARALSVANYLLSIGAKSASMPLLIFLSRGKKILILPLGLSCAFFLYKLFTSQLALDGIKLALITSSFTSIPEFILNTVPQTISWYFWQALLPLDSIPIRGPVPNQLIPSLVGLVTIITFLALIYKHQAFKYFIGFFIMLTPFLGLIPGPFMTSTWVSDQHLYLALIFFIPGLCLLIENIPSMRVKIFSKMAVIIFFCALNFSNIDNYKDEFHFFKSSFDYNHNLAAAYQLINYYSTNHRLEDARAIYFQILSSNPYEGYLENNFFWLKIHELEPGIFED